MKVFISWSGELSRRIASALREWLPHVIQALEPFVSDKDVYTGFRWSAEIAAELEASQYGILCITPDNMKAPWLNFEAGALSKDLGEGKGRVIPLLWQMQETDLKHPLAQFQGVVCNRDGVRKVVEALNGACQDRGLSESHLDTAFDTWWEQLKGELDKLPKPSPKQPEKETNGGISDSDVMQEILQLVRQQSRILASPETLLSSRYLTEVVGRTTNITRNLRAHLAEPRVGQRTLNVLEWCWRQLGEALTLLESPDIEHIETACIMLRKIETLLEEAIDDNIPEDFIGYVRSPSKFG